MSGGRWLVVLVTTALVGWSGGELMGAQSLATSSGYQWIVMVLLGIGLYGSTSGISLTLARQELGVIVFASTIGVVVKAVVITGAMYAFVDSRVAILGLVVAQIDPLSVAALLGRSGMSDRAKTILQAWSSFDDPVTTLLTIYALAWIGTGARGGALVGETTLLGYAGGLGQNVLFAGGAYLLWLALDRLLRPGARWLPPDQRRARVIREAVLLTVLAALFGVAIWRVLMLGLAITGLFFRPAMNRLLPQVLNGALIAATFALGLLLTSGISPGAGCALAAFAILAQVIATCLLPTWLTATDRWSLALGQQNGITAIILALAIEPVVSGAVAIVAPAILVINVFHLASNGALTRWLSRSQSDSAQRIPPPPGSTPSPERPDQDP